MDWKLELQNRTKQYHTIGAWVAIILNIAWSVGDYIEIPSYWLKFLIIRLIVSFSTLFTLLLFKKKNFSPIWLVFVPFLGIALQNAYMYNVMDVITLQKHTFAYIALFIGAGMLALWPIKYTITIVVLNFIANFILFNLLSPLSLSDYLVDGAMLMFTVSIFSILLIQTRYSLNVKEIKSRLELEKSKQEIASQKEIIEGAHHEVQSSITYASRIQNALLSTDESWERISQNHFILFKPRDVVSGDFYWAYEKEGIGIWAAADCTGHGVPGAFMSMLGVGFLNEIVAEGGETDPSQILENLRTKIISALEQKGSDTQQKDGMDIAICTMDRNSNKLLFSGAYNPLYIIRKRGLNNEITDAKITESDNYNLYEIKADKQPIGKHTKDKNPFTTKSINLIEGDLLYTFSDGYVDQFGGPDGRKFMSKRFKELILTINEKSMSNQSEILDTIFQEWINESNSKQIDDVCVVGVQV